MRIRVFLRIVVAALLLASAATPALAQDVNLTPKRIVFDDRARGAAQVIVFNRGDAAAKFKIELIDRVMKPDGSVIEAPGPTIDSAKSFIRFSPRRVTLAPGESQVVRIQARPPADLPAGEYRTHLTVSAIPSTDAGPQAARGSGERKTIQIRLVPIYGMSIPIIVRRGALSAEVGIEDIRPVQSNGARAVSFVLVRKGTSSAYGDIDVELVGRGASRSIAVAKGLGVYPEITRRTVVLPLRADAPALGPGARLHVVYREDHARRGSVLAEQDVLLP